MISIVTNPCLLFIKVLFKTYFSFIEKPLFLTSVKIISTIVIVENLVLISDSTICFIFSATSVVNGSAINLQTEEPSFGDFHENPPVLQKK